VIKVHHVDCLPCELYGIWHQHSTDILAQLDNDWN